jgi:arylsulfatase
MILNKVIPTIGLSLFGLMTIPSVAQNKPNFVVILLDDMGYGDLSSTGSRGYKTPNIDKMANNGVRFTNFYVAQAVCGASRAGLLTGCYPNRIGISGAPMPHSPIGISSKEETIADVLKKVGYSTAMFGKWHLGDSKNFLPTHHGFDEYFGIPYSHDMWPNHPQIKTFPDLPLIEGDSVVELNPDHSQFTKRFTERAVNFINKNKRKPFFLYLAHPMPHVPLSASDKFKGKSKQGLYGDVMMELDWSVGEILSTLQRNGIDKNTLVIFTSDNGPWLNYGNHAGSTSGLREGKGTSWEGGQRVPCIMHWPGVISPGLICNNLASTIDILPTFAQLSNAKLPENKIDGISILPLLRNEANANPRSNFYYYYQKNSLEAVTDGEWKLVFPHKFRSYENNLPGNDGNPGNVSEQSVALMLFDLRRDPGERYNVLELYPDVVKRLNKIADEARIDLGDDLQQVEGKNRRSPGQINN